MHRVSTFCGKDTASEAMQLEERYTFLSKVSPLAASLISAKRRRSGVCFDCACRAATCREKA